MDKLMNSPEYKKMMKEYRAKKSVLDTRYNKAIHDGEFQLAKNLKKEINNLKNKLERDEYNILKEKGYAEKYDIEEPNLKPDELFNDEYDKLKSDRNEALSVLNKQRDRLLKDKMEVSSEKSQKKMKELSIKIKEINDKFKEDVKMLNDKDDLKTESQIEESIINTILHPILSGKALDVFFQELKRWKTIGFISKIERNRLLSKIRIYIKDIDQPYTINITGIMSDNLEDKKTVNFKQRFKNRLYGKIKSPFKIFQTFTKYGFYEIFDDLFDSIENDVDKGKIQKSLKIDDKEEVSKWEDDFNKKLFNARSKVNIFKQIDAGKFAVGVSVNMNDLKEESRVPTLKEEILANSGVLILEGGCSKKKKKLFSADTEEAEGDDEMESIDTEKKKKKKCSVDTNVDGGSEAPKKKKKN